MASNPDFVEYIRGAAQRRGRNHMQKNVRGLRRLLRWKNHRLNL